MGIVGNSFQRFLHTGQYIEQLKQDIVNGMAQTTCDSSWMCTAGLPNQYKLPGKIQKRTMVRKFNKKSETFLEIISVCIPHGRKH